MFFSDANLFGADLEFANLTRAHLTRANLSGALFAHTVLGSVDLSKTLAIYLLQNLLLAQKRAGHHVAFRAARTRHEELERHPSCARQAWAQQGW